MLEQESAFPNCFHNVSVTIPWSSCSSCNEGLPLLFPILAATSLDLSVAHFLSSLPGTSFYCLCLASKYFPDTDLSLVPNYALTLSFRLYACYLLKAPTSATLDILLGPASGIWLIRVPIHSKIRRTKDKIRTGKSTMQTSPNNSYRSLL